MSEEHTAVPKPRNRLRGLLIVLASVLLLLLLLLGAMSFLLSTEAGSHWALTRAVASLNGSAGIRIEIDRPQGTILRGMSFGRVRVVDESAIVTIQDLRTSWNPYTLLTGGLSLSDIEISNLRVEIQDSDPSPQAEPIAFSNPLPMGAVLSSLRVERLEIVQQGQLTVASSIRLGAELDDAGIELSAIELSAEGANLTGDIAVAFTDAVELSGLLDWNYELAFENRIEQLDGSLQLDGNLSRLSIDHQLKSPQRIRSTGNIVSGLGAEAFSFELHHTADTLTLPVEIPYDYALSEISLDSSGDLDELALELQTNLQYEQFPSVAIGLNASYTDTELDIHTYMITEATNRISGAALIDWSGVLSIEGSYALALENIESFVDLPTPVQLEGLIGAGDFDLDWPESGVEGGVRIESFDGLLADYPLRGQGSLFFRGGALELSGLQLLTENNRLSLDGSIADTLDLKWSLSAESLDEFLVDSRGALEGQGSLQGELGAPNITGLLSGNSLGYKQFDASQLAFYFQRVDGIVRSELTLGALKYSDGSAVESLSELDILLAGTEGRHSIDLGAQSKYGDVRATILGGMSSGQAPSWRGSLQSASIDTPIGSWSARDAVELSLTSAEQALSESCWIQQASTICFSMRQSVEDGLSVDGSLQQYPLSVFNAGQKFDAGANINLVDDELLLLPQLPLGTAIAGSVGGQFHLSLSANEELGFDFRLAASDALLEIMPAQMETSEDYIEDVTPQEYNLETLELSGELTGGVWSLSAEAGILRENLDDSEIDVRGEITARIGIAPDSSLTGTVEAGLADLRWLQVLVPEFSNIGGSLVAQASLGGTLEAPEGTGSIHLSAASVSINTLGIDLNDIDANLSSDSLQSIQIVGRASSDVGSLDFNGEVLEFFGRAPSFSAEVRGENFQLANIPNLQLTVSPNVVVNADAQSIEIIGSIDVPTLNVTLEELPETAIDVSRDVVIVSYPSDRPDLARSIAATETTAFDLPLAGAVDITLGNEVSFSGFGISSKLQGNLNIHQTLGGSNRTYGELSIVEGTYEMYRQSLNISQGKLLFFGAYDNPGIDLRATREVEGFTVGVLMNGTIKNINSQLFSTPELADNDIISVLVTGRPFSEIGQQDGDGDAVLTAIAKLGVGRSEGLTNQVRNKLGLDVLTVDPTDDINNSVLTIGKYLTPDIFIRYGVGLFDSQSKVAVDYTLSERLKLQAESGEYQSIDILYSVER